MTTEKDKARVSDNELIAEFMGEEISAVVANHGLPIKVLVLPRKPISEFKTGRPIECKYTTSWDWIMPVVERIVAFCDQIIALSTEWHRVYVRPLNLALMRANINDVYKAVVQFIKWYNEQR